MSLSSRTLLLTTNEFRPGGSGVAAYCYGLAQAIYELGQKIAVVAASKSSQDYIFDQAQGFPIRRMAEHPLQPLRHLIRLKTLFKYLQVYRPVYLWAADWRTGLVVSFLASLHGIPYAVTAYGSEILLAHSNVIRRSLALRVYNRARTVLAISNYTKHLLRYLGVREEKIIVTPLGVDPNKWRTDPVQCETIIRRHDLAGKNVILSLARLTPRKGQDMVIKALPRVLESIPDTVYVIAGKGEDEGRLRRLAADLGLEKQVVFAGFVDESEKPAYYHVCDVYCMPSRQEAGLVEGFGLTLLEAGACGKPTVAGRHGGIEDAVIDGKTGLLIDSHNPEELAKALLELLTNKDKATRMGRNGRLRVQTESNWHNVAQQTLKVLERAI